MSDRDAMPRREPAASNAVDISVGRHHNRASLPELPERTSGLLFNNRQPIGVGAVLGWQE